MTFLLNLSYVNKDIELQFYSNKICGITKLTFFTIFKRKVSLVLGMEVKNEKLLLELPCRALRPVEAHPHTSPF